MKERQKSTNEESVGSGRNEVIALEGCDDESQKSFTDLELTQQLNKSDDNNKEISSTTTTDSRPQKESSDESVTSVSARKMGTNERHETTSDLECSDGITKSLMTPTLDEKPHDVDSTLPEIDKSGSDGEFDPTLNEEHNNEDSSQGELELTLKRKAQDGRPTAPDCVVPSAGNETSRGKMHQLRDEISGTEEPGGTVKAKAKKRFSDTTSSKIPNDCNPYRCDKCGKVMSNFKNYKSHVKGEVGFEQTRDYPLHREVFHARILRKGIQPALQSGAASAGPHWGEAVQVRHLRQELPSVREFEEALEDSHGREAVHLQRLRQGVLRLLGLQKPPAASFRREAF